MNLILLSLKKSKEHLALLTAPNICLAAKIESYTAFQKADAILMQEIKKLL